MHYVRLSNEHVLEVQNIRASVKYSTRHQHQVRWKVVMTDEITVPMYAYTSSQVVCEVEQTNK